MERTKESISSQLDRKGEDMMNMSSSHVGGLVAAVTDGLPEGDKDCHLIITLPVQQRLVRFPIMTVNGG